MRVVTSPNTSKGFRKKTPIRSWVDGKFRSGFRGYPIATVAFYGPNDKLATKVVVSVFLTESNDPDFLQRWFSDDDLDIRQDLAIGEQILTFLNPYGPRSTVVTEGLSAARTKKAWTTQREWSSCEPLNQAASWTTPRCRTPVKDGPCTRHRDKLSRASLGRSSLTPC